MVRLRFINQGIPKREDEGKDPDIEYNDLAQWNFT
jgi:hypothetical protein